MKNTTIVKDSTGEIKVDWTKFNEQVKEYLTEHLRLNIKQETVYYSDRTNEIVVEILLEDKVIAYDTFRIV